MEPIDVDEVPFYVAVCAAGKDVESAWPFEPSLKDAKLQITQSNGFAQSARTFRAVFERDPSRCS